MVLARESYLRDISNNLAILQNSIEFRTESNLHDLGIIAEDFIKGLLNIVFDLQLENLNSIMINQPSVDLGDTVNKVAVQVTSTTSREKVKSTIDKFISHKLYERYSQLYVFTLKEKQQKYQEFETLDYFTFDEKKDILDFKSLLSEKINHLPTDKLLQVHKFIDREISRPARESKTIKQLNYVGDIPSKLKTWEYKPFFVHYVNIHRLIGIAANSGLHFVDVPTAKLDRQGSIGALPFNEYHELMAFTAELLKHWKPSVLNLENPTNLTKDFTGCVFEFFQTDFRSKNIKFWNKNTPHPTMHGILKKDPYLYIEVADVKAYLPLNLAWMTTNTSYHNFGLGNQGIAESLSGICILKSISSSREAILTPLLIGIYDFFGQIEDALAQGDRNIEMRSSW